MIYIEYYKTTTKPTLYALKVWDDAGHSTRISDYAPFPKLKAWLKRKNLPVIALKDVEFDRPYECPGLVWNPKSPK